MPLFEYQCKSCGRRFEKLVFGASTPSIACPACDSREVEKQFSTFGFGGGRRDATPGSFGGG
jgi:putative FmdB family regulatory protein